MSFLEKAEKFGNAVAKGTSGYLERQARQKSKNENFPEEARDAFRQYADNMKGIHDSYLDKSYDDEY